MVITLQLHTVVQHINQEVLMVLTEPQVREGSMGRHQGVPPAVIMEVTGDSLMEDIMDIMLLQATSLLVLTQRRTSGSRLSTLTTAVSSTQRS